MWSPQQATLIGPAGCDQSPPRTNHLWILMAHLWINLWMPIVFGGSNLHMVCLFFSFLQVSASPGDDLGLSSFPTGFLRGAQDSGGTNLGVPLLICCTTALCYVAVNPGNPSLDPLNVMCRGETLVPRLGTGRGCYPSPTGRKRNWFLPPTTLYPLQ